MPIEKIYVDSMLGTFRNFLKECEEKKASGTAFENMKSTLARMEQLAVETGDISEFSVKLTTGHLMVDFGTAYGEVLSELAKKSYSGNDGDEKLLQQTLEAYENSIKSLKGIPKSELIIPAIQEVVDLGRSGISYPVFLRICEEKGLNKAMEGSLVTREGIVLDIRVATMFEWPLELQKANELLVKYDELAGASPFGIPDSTQFGLERIKLDWKYAPDFHRRDAICQRWDNLFGYLHDWLDSYCSFAPHDPRWASMTSMAVTMKNIKRCKECNPGIFRVKEKIFYDYFGLAWKDIFNHETFLNELKARRIWYSDESLELIKETWEHCRPSADPPTELIRKAEEIHSAKRFKRPGCYQLSEEGRQLFINVFGQEEYDKKYGKYQNN
ncbi:MAG: hypothetical protein NTU98_04315 [Bacteroidetes bacterium]|nr:hypothetical protein [Bacteroidota bacterium]